MGGSFVTCDLEDILVGEPLPGNVYLYIDFRFITFRAEGDVIDRATYQRLEMRKVKNLFIVDADRQKFSEWTRQLVPSAPPPVSAEFKEFHKAREDVHRKMYDIFSSEHPDKIVTETLSASKQLVNEVMKFSFAVQTLSHLQTYSRGTVDHSINVSALSVYLAMQMGYSHQLILQHVGTGGLLHDIGKPKVVVAEDEKPEVFEQKMKDHPTLGLKLIESHNRVPNEVKMIIAQHHECYDGTGFPKKLRGSAIYDLARIVAIANTFDELVSDSSGTLKDRQKAALTTLDQTLYKKFDPQKLDKALKILKLGI